MVFDEIKQASVFKNVPQCDRERGVAPPHHTQLFFSTNARNASPALFFELPEK